MKAKKIKGFMVLPAVLMSILLGLLGLSFLQIYSGQFSALSSNRTAIQAQQFAQSEADRLRNTAYDSLSGAAHARTAISGGNGWQSLVSLGAETTVNEVKQRMATVNVYRNGTVTTPDFSLQVPLSSAGSGGRIRNIISGVVYDGSKLPLPDNAKLENCIYLLSLAVMNGTQSDNKYQLNHKIYVDNSGIVHCNTYTNGRDGTGGKYRGWASFIVIDTGSKVSKYIDANWNRLLENSNFQNEQNQRHGGWYSTYLNDSSLN